MLNVELQQLIKALDKESHQALEQAAQLCVSRGGQEVLCEDVILALLNNPKSFWNNACQQFELCTNGLVKTLQHGRKISTNETLHPVLSPALIAWLQEAYLFATLQLKQQEILSGCLLLALLTNPVRYGHAPYFEVLNQIPADKLENQLLGLIETAHQQQSRQVDGDETLEAYTTNYTQLARDHRIDPVLCRDQEIRQMIDILARRRKNNPMIVGEAGVGKTALVEGLALKIAAGEVPDILADVTLLSLDLGLLQAGASIKGEFERRLNAVINAVQQNPTPIILFIDEAHTLIGAGGQAGGNDAANLLKPALARGELRTIGATTWSEYKKYIEKDPALARRFQPIKVDEPDVEQATTILRGLAGRYEEAHGVYIRDDAISAAAELSARYLTGRQLPDKAIDLLDTACARVKINLRSKPEPLEKHLHQIAITERELQSHLRDQEAGLEKDPTQIEALQELLTTSQIEYDALEMLWHQQTELAQALLDIRSSINTVSDEDKQAKIEHQTRLASELAELKAQADLVNYEVCPALIGEVIAHWTGIPLGTLMKARNEQVLNIRQQLKDQIKGQDDAVIALEQAVQATAAGLNNPNAPTGVFLFVGPSGIGKTQTAQAIANLMYGGEQFLTTINMSEFQEKHTVSRLIGSPPGYVGYGEGGVLTEAVRQRPYSVILLDEVEKADPEVMNLFYQIFDKGIVNDGEGREINFRQTLIIMTSNLASDVITQLCEEQRPDSQTLKTAIRPTLNHYFKPALVARMNIVPFYPLEQDTLAQLAEIRMNQLGEQLARQNIAFTFDDEVLSHIAASCTLTETGARNIDALINGQLKPILSVQIIAAMSNNTPLLSIHLGQDENGHFCCEFKEAE